MNTQLMLNYLADLSANNHREWYHAHKAENKAASAQFEELVQALMCRIGEFDGSVLGHAPKDLTFKMVPRGEAPPGSPRPPAFSGYAERRDAQRQWR